jgi:hypothetical protein
MIDTRDKHNKEDAMETDKATPRPWRMIPGMHDRIGGPDLTIGHIAHIYAKGEPYHNAQTNEIAYPAEGQAANAALIIRAVNAYNAHQALAVAAHNALTLIGDAEAAQAMGKGCEQCTLNEARASVLLREALRAVEEIDR